MNATTWKYHPRRSPRKSSRKIAARLAIAALDMYRSSIGEFLPHEAQMECLLAKTGRITFTNGNTLKWGTA